MGPRKARTPAEGLDQALASLKYGEAKERLEKILEGLESDEVDIDDLADKVKEAAALIRVLHEKLTRTRGEVEKVMEEVRVPGPAPQAEAGPAS
ncbi:MAG: exodeoxyribonuclease VII small subunit [Planctomycetes bacterium]|nr:exodeoxyribonuclease VII small subunit [Planctomycetota bacterium]